MPISVRNGLFLKVWLMLCMGLGALGFATPAMAQTTTYSNTTASTGGAVNENATPCATPLVRNFVVGTSYTVTDVDIGVLVTHSYRGDLQMTLQSPAGTRVRFFNQGGAGANNYNVMVDDESGPSVNADGADHSTIAPPYQNNFSAANPAGTVSPDTPLSAFDGQNALGTWRLEICDNAGGDFGDFARADLRLTQLPTNYADLSLTKIVSNAAPTNGATITYTLSVNNAATSPQTANAVTVADVLPGGVTFVSATGFGTYSNATGVWTVGSIPAGTTRTLTITVTVSATAGATITNSAEVSASSIVDLDSTAGNGSVTEDDDADVSFTVAGARAAGTPPTLICPNGSSLFDWNTRAWLAGTPSNNYAVTNLGNAGFTTVNPGAWLNLAIYGGQSPALQTTMTGGFPITPTPPESSLFLGVNLADRNQTANATITLETPVAGVQFRIFDVDFNAAQFADRVVVTGFFNGAPVVPTLTNGIANYVIGNTAYGDAVSADNQENGNVVVTFSTPIDTILINYGNHAAAPADPGQQAISIHDITICNAQASISATKVSSVIADGINASNFKAIPGATLRYCILVGNSGPSNATNVAINDVLPTTVTYQPGTLATAANCTAAQTAEDDDAAGPDETNPFGASIAGTTVTATAAKIISGASFAVIFNATIN
jgi:uncharacterized repeat protein (TIGR01451 family)